MKHMLHDQVSKGYMKKVQFDNRYFISQGFVQVKPGCYYLGTNLPMVRLLADCRALNRSCVDSPLHHYECCPTQQDMCSRIPLGSKFFKQYDISDAFHSCKVSDESADLLVVQFGNEYYQYTGGAQGIANMAVHWNIHLTDAFDKILGLHWRGWFTLYSTGGLKQPADQNNLFFAF